VEKEKAGVGSAAPAVTELGPGDVWVGDAREPHRSSSGLPS